MGRPRKPVVPSNGDSALEPPSPVRKRPYRGLNPGSPALPAGTSPAKRPRGRPPKSPLRRARPAKALSINGAAALVQRLAESSQNGAFSANLQAASEVSEAALLAADTPAKVTALLDLLVTTEQDQLFSAFRAKSAEQSATDSRHIAELGARLEARQATIDTLVQQLQELQDALSDAETRLKPGQETPQRHRAEKHMYESPIRKKSAAAMVPRSAVDDEFKTIAFTFDMLELLTGVRIIDYSVDADRFLFDVKQSSTVADHDGDVVTVEYQLLIQRDFQEKAEVTYVPVFLDSLDEQAQDAESEARAKDAARVRAHLPPYLQLSLNFPYNTLLQFYAKLSKALNKCTKA